VCETHQGLNAVALGLVAPTCWRLRAELASPPRPWPASFFGSLRDAEELFDILQI
jgi:hypothetical protein